MLWKTFESNLSPAQVRERIDFLPDLSGSTSVKENTVCGIPTWYGGELWMLVSDIYYKLGSGPVPLLVRVKGGPNGCCVRCRFSSIKNNLRGTLFLFSFFAYTVIGDCAQEKITWWDVLPGLLIAAIELFAIISFLSWAGNKVERAFSHKVRQRDKLLLEWVEGVLLGERGLTIDADSALRSEVRHKHWFIYRCPYPEESLWKKLEEWVRAENQRRSEQTVSRIKGGKQVQEPRRDRMELIWKGRKFILRSDRMSSQFVACVEENTEELVIKGHFSLAPLGKACSIAFGALLTLWAWRVPLAMFLLIGIYLSFEGRSLFYAERLKNSMEIVRFLREHLEEESTELGFGESLREKGKEHKKK